MKEDKGPLQYLTDPYASPDLRAHGVGRIHDNPNCVLVSFNRESSDDELRALHEFLRTFRGTMNT